MKSIYLADGTSLRVPRTHFWNSELGKSFCGQRVEKFCDGWAAVTCGMCLKLHRLREFNIPFHGVWPRPKKSKVCSKCGQEIPGSGG